MPKRTLKRIAESLGVSTATVSLAMRGSPRISERTKERVRAALDEAGYVYQRTAAGLRTARTHTVGVVLNNISDPFYVSLLAELEESFSQAGLTMFLGSTNESTERQSRFLRTMAEYNADGLVLCPSIDTTLNEIESISESHPPLVFISRHLPNAPFDHVINDDAAGAQIGARHLVSLGHERITLIGGHASLSTFQSSLAGYKAALKEAGIQFREDYILPCTPVRSGGVAAADWVMSLDPRPTGAICFNDIVALGLNSGLRQHGIEVGKDFSIVGHENIEETALSWPPMTVTSVAFKEMGRQVSKLLIERIAEPDLPPRQVVLGSRLIERKSCHRVDKT